MNRERIKLLHLQDQAHAVGSSMNEEARRFRRIAGAEPTRAVSSFNLFQTPEPLARRMADMLADRMLPDGRWLEPSAGLGRLYRAGRAVGLVGSVTLIEDAKDCARELYTVTDGDEQARLLVGNFLTMRPGEFDGVLMNPPFQRGTDIKHITHAAQMLRPGGWLVAVCYDGIRQGQDLRPLAETWEPLPAGSFRSEGTNAGVVLLTIQA